MDHSLSDAAAGRVDRTVILGVAASDAHAVANQLIAIQLRQHGFRVINLGVCTPLEEFATALRKHPETDAVLIGSLNGHAHQDLAGLPAMRCAGLLDRPIVLGGNLSVGSRKAEQDVARLLALGVDHIVADMSELLPLLDTLCAAREREPQRG